MKTRKYLDFEQFQRTKTGWKGFYKGHWYGTSPDSNINGYEIPEEILELNAEETLEILKDLTKF